MASLCISLLCSVCSVSTRMFWVRPYKKLHILHEPVAKGKQEISSRSVQRNVFEAVGALLSLPTAVAGTQPPALRATTQPVSLLPGGAAKAFPVTCFYISASCFCCVSVVATRTGGCRAVCPALREDSCRRTCSCPGPCHAVKVL